MNQSYRSQVLCMYKQYKLKIPLGRGIFVCIGRAVWPCKLKGLGCTHCHLNVCARVYAQFTVLVIYIFAMSLKEKQAVNRLSSYGFLQNAAFFSIVVAGMYLPYWWLRMNECNVCLEKREKFFLSYMYGHGHPVRNSFKNIPIVFG